MFGFIRIEDNELKVKELRLYKAYYCSLCRQIAEYSHVARLMLSYDMVFLALLLESRIYSKNKLCKKRLFNDCRKECGDEKIDYAAAVSIILQYHKLKNDYIDGERKKILPMYAIEKGFNKARDKFPIISSQIDVAMIELYRLEKMKCSDYSTLIKCFSGMFEVIIQEASSLTTNSDIKSKLIYNVASWIYLFDMYVDIEKDTSTGDFNAIILNGGDKEAKKNIYEILITVLKEAESLSNLLPYSNETSIIQNIVSYGLPMQMKKSFPSQLGGVI